MTPQQPEDPPFAAARPGTIRRLALPALLVALLAAAWASGLANHVSLSGIIAHKDALAAQVAANRPLALAAFVAIYAALVAISFPGGALLTLAGGFLFGGLTGAIASVIGATAGAVLVFLIARSSFGGALERRAGGFASKMAEGFRQDAFSYLLSLRLAPVFPFWVVNIVPAVLNMRLAPYAMATFVGIVPATFAIAQVGSGLGSVIEAQEAIQPGCAAARSCHVELHSLLTPQILWALAGLALLALVPVAARRLSPLKRQAQPPAS